MKKYEIDFDENNNVLVKVDGDQIEEDKIDDVFREINDLSISSSNTFFKNAHFEADDATVSIYNLSQFEKGNYIEYMPNLFDEYIKTLKEYNKKRLNRLHKNNRKHKFILVSVSSLVLILISLGMINHKVKEVKEEKIAKEFDIDDLIGTIEGLEIPQANKEEIKKDYNAKHAPKITINQEKIEEYKSKEEIKKENKRKEEKAKEKMEITELDYVSKYGSEDASYAYDNYYKLIDKCAKRYGISTNLLLGLLTQESRGREDNLTQIVFSCWDGARIKVFDFNENKWKEFVITSNPSLYSNEDVTIITESDLYDPELNITTCCLILRDCFERMNNHIGAGIMSYNIGYPAMLNVLDTTAYNYGITREDILKDQKNLSFMDYTYIAGMGDQDYLNHVLQFVGDPNLTIKIADEKGNIREESVCINEEKNKTR